MPVQNFSVPQGNCPAGQKTVSADALINNNPKSVFVRLTSTEWDTKAGQGTLRWGVERQPPAGAWAEWLSNPGVAFGQRGGKDGLLPAIAITGGQMTSMIGWRVRLFAAVSSGAVGILLGADVAVTT